MKKILISLITSILATTSLIAAPQAIVFDFGGVMTGKPNPEVVVRFIQESFHFSPEQFDKINLEKRQAIQQGKTDAKFWISYANENGIELPNNWEESFKAVLKTAIGVNSNMYVLVEELRSKEIPVVLLSNINERLAKLMREFDLYSPFNPCLLSCEIGLEKPDTKIYEYLLKELTLSAEDVIFVDDILENVEAAKSMGIDAILFESEQHLRTELIKRGVSVLKPLPSIAFD